MPGCPFPPLGCSWIPSAGGIWLLVLAGVVVGLPCQVDPENQMGMCAGLELEQVPPGLLKTLHGLNLSYNKLQEVTAGGFARMMELRHLDLGYNSISHIAPDTFQTNLLLEHLWLFNNSLEHILVPVLRPLLHLHRLDVSNNLYSSATLDGAFTQVQSLPELSLGGVLLWDISRQDFLVLRDTPLCRFAIKSASSQWHYESGAFSWLNATELWCDLTLEKSTAVLLAILRDLRDKPLQALCFHNLFEFTYYTVDADTFARLAELQITKLEFYHGKVNEHLLHLMLLQLCHSHVRNLALVAIDFACLPWYNSSGAAAPAPQFDCLLLQGISNLDVLCFDWTFTWLSGVAALSIIYVSFNSVPCDAWAEMCNVEVLDVSNNCLEGAIIYNQHCHYQGTMPKLESLVLAANQLLSLAVAAALTWPWQRFARLDASHNSLDSLWESCHWSPTLRWLSLHHNQVSAATFGCLPTSLEYLDLYSQLDCLDVDFFTWSLRLWELWLSGNKIKFIPSEWHCPCLEVLAIDGNSFGVIPRGSFAQMLRLISLMAGNNPFHCTCDLHMFLEETWRGGPPHLGRLAAQLDLLPIQHHCWMWLWPPLPCSPWPVTCWRGWPWWWLAQQ